MKLVLPLCHFYLHLNPYEYYSSYGKERFHKPSHQEYYKRSNEIVSRFVEDPLFELAENDFDYRYLCRKAVNKYQSMMDKATHQEKILSNMMGDYYQNDNMNHHVHFMPYL